MTDLEQQALLTQIIAEQRNNHANFAAQLQLKLTLAERKVAELQRQIDEAATNPE